MFITLILAGLHKSIFKLNLSALMAYFQRNILKRGCRNKTMLKNHNHPLYR